MPSDKSLLVDPAFTLKEYEDQTDPLERDIGSYHGAFCREEERLDD